MRLALQQHKTWMKTPTALLVAGAVCALCSAAHALYSVANTGLWPKSWPRQLEPLRTQARTLVGPELEARHYAIRFTSREQFEAAWPQLLKVKTKGAPVILVRGENFFLGDKARAGVIVHAPPQGQGEHDPPIAGVKNPRVRWRNATYIEVVVDGDVIDAGRIRIPAGTRIDERSRREAP